VQTVDAEAKIDRNNLMTCYLKTNVYKIHGSWARVTRLGKVSPNGRLFTSGRFSYITDVAQDFWTTLSLFIDFVLILTKNGLGYILGDFFTNPSGHPGQGNLDLSLMAGILLSDSD
jgi:hypothetical protein